MLVRDWDLEFARAFPAALERDRRGRREGGLDRGCFDGSRRAEIAVQERAGVASGWEATGGFWELGFRHANISSTSWLYSHAATPRGSKS